MAWRANIYTFVLCIFIVSRFSSVIAQAAQNPDQQVLQDVQLQQAQVPSLAPAPINQVPNVQQVPIAQQVPPVGQQQADVKQQAAQPQAPQFQGQQQQPVNPAGNDPRDGVQLERHIIDFEVCKEDIHKHCVKPGLDLKSDIGIIECLQNVKLSETELLNAQCEHLIWEFKVNLTQDDRFRIAAKSFCQNEMLANPNMAQCAERLGPGLALSCFIDFILTLPRESRCFAFLDRSARLAFSDFRVVGPFVEKCGSAIKKLQCGTLTPPSAHAKVRVPHTQGHTLECLIAKIYQAQQKDPSATVVDEECRHEIMRIAELQSDDFHLDRQLFFACREDREKFCKEVPSGEGKVLECLLTHRTDALMEPQCSVLLSERASMMGENVRMAHPLLNGCAQELREFQCMPSSQFSGSPNFHLSWVLLCLENAARLKPARLSGKCQHEMLTHRKLMMSEFRLSPEVVMSCGREIDIFCSPKGDIEKEGRTLHCLMQHAKERDPKKQLGPQCMQAIQTVAKVADVGSNYKVDQVLYASCRKLIEGPCAMDAQSEASTLTCLMRHMDVDMPKECEDRLVEIQYFMARDWTLDPQLYQACHEEAVLKCSANPNWHMAANLQNQPDPGPMVLACLYRAAYNEEEPLSEACGANVRRVLRTRAVRVNLMPEIEASCRGALSEYCSVDVKPMQELKCLQEHFEESEFISKYKECNEAVSDFTKLMAKDTELNQALTKACRPVITTYCQQYANEEIDHGDVLECLLAHKDRPEMTSKCRSYVNHFELITLRDYKFSYRFKTACEADIKKYCSDAGVDKAAIIRCLSSVVFEHKVLGTPEDLEKDCKKQLKTAYLQQEQVNFDQKSHMEDADPVLMKKCKGEVNRFKCQDRRSFEDVVECLRENFEDLGPDCKAVVFAREKIEAADNRFDDELQSECRADIDKFCRSEDADRVLDCLQNTKILRLLSKDCQKVVLERMREQVKDVRLNVGLFSACKQEAERYCPADFKKINDPQYAMKTLEGVIVSCLRTKYVDPSVSVNLNEQCKNEISKVIMESEFDIQLDPLLYRGCKNTITTQCSENVLKQGGTFASVMECLKHYYKQGSISDAECSKQIARRLQESLVDLHLDPVLNEACANDVLRLCRGVPPGQSRLVICLLDSLKANENSLSPRCKEKLVERNELWNKAHREQAMILPETLNDVMEIVSKHPQRFSLLTWFGAFILLLFFIGCCCGRASKRIKRELKNR